MHPLAAQARPAPPDHEYDLRITADYAVILELRRGLCERWLPRRLSAFRITAGQASQRFQAQLQVEFTRVRLDAWARTGWSEHGVGWLRFAYWPSLQLRQKLR